MPERDPQIDDRVEQLERDLRRLQASIDRGAADRESITSMPRNPRLAKTSKQTSGGTYPDLSDSPNTYWIRFLDSTFTETEGDQTPTHTARQADGAALAHVIDGGRDFLAEDTVVIVTFDNKRWWIIHVVTGDMWATAVSNVSDPATDGDWEENSGDPRVWCKVSDRDGTNVRGDGFWIALPRQRGASTDLDPSVYVGDVIKWEIDDEGTPVCSSPYLWSKIGDVKIRVDITVPTGWNICDGSTQGAVTLLDFTGDEGRVAKQRVSGESVGDQGGLLEFLVSHVDGVTIDGAVANVDEIDDIGSGSSGGDNVENRGPFTVVEFIQRWK